MTLVKNFRTPEDHPSHLGKFAVLLFVLLAIVVTFPFVEEGSWVNYLVAGIGLLTILSALWAVSNSLIVFIIGLVLAIPAFILNILNTLADDWHFAYYAVPMSFAFYLLVNLNLLRSVLQAKVVTRDILCGAICVYLLLGMNWTLIYTFLDMVDPNSFHYNLGHDQDGGLASKDYFYFSFVTLTTLGYGDIVPLSVPARIFAVLEAIAGLMYVAVIIGKIIGMALVNMNTSTQDKSAAVANKPNSQDNS